MGGLAAAVRGIIVGRNRPSILSSQALRYVEGSASASARRPARFSFSSVAGESGNDYGENIRWGILSAGKISSDFVKAIGITEGAKASAVAARSHAKAETFASEHSIPAAYGSYDELLADPTVDVVYVGSIADEHANLAAKALLAGKPTVVEKPLTISSEETRKLVALAKENDTFLMEGMWTRCFPAMRRVRDLVASGAIGPISVVQGDFGWSTEGCGPDDRIWNPRSGGMVLDIGMYLAQLGNVAFPNADVKGVQAMGMQKNGIDHTALVNVKYGKAAMLVEGGGRQMAGESTSQRDESEGGMLQFYVTGNANTEERVVMEGTQGRIIIESPAHVPSSVRLIRNGGRGVETEEVFDHPLPDDTFSTWNYPGSVGFTYQIKEVGDALRRGEKECRHFTLKESLQVADMLDEVLDQVRGQGWRKEEDKEEAATSAATSI
mmetsp:Transcript_50415/g.151864  ORF Transcript_50415/g.151864 Transcript_50415/m.151864 type:complete len:438 (-) Transcript_50415:282-1595(-)